MEACRFFSRTIVDKFRAACVMFEWVTAPFVGTGVVKPVSKAELCSCGVEAPLLFWVARTEASLRDASAMICLMFLFRRCEGFQ